MIRSAIISPCGTYRFELFREFEPEESVCLADSCMFALNNPSTADGQSEDATSRRGKGYCASWGYRRYYFGNTNPWRSTDPSLARMPPEDVLLENDEHLRRMARESSVVVAAWGGDANPLLASRALRVLLEVGPVHALAYTKAGVPRHPLYLKSELTPQLWRPAMREGDQR